MIVQAYKNLKPSDRRALHLCVAFLVVIGGYVNVVEPLLQRFEAVAAKQEKLEKKRREYARNVRMLPRREAKLNAYRQEMAQFALRFPALQPSSTELETVRTIPELMRYARLSGVLVKEIRPLASSTQSGYVDLPFELRVNATNYDDFQRFLYYLEASGRLLIVTDLDVKADLKGARKGLDRFQARVKFSNVLKHADEEAFASALPDLGRRAETLRILLPKRPWHAPLLLAAERLNAEQGNRIKLEFIEDAISAESMLLGANVDGVVMSLTRFLNAISRGMELKALTVLSHGAAQRGVVASWESGIQSVSQLQGRAIGVEKGGVGRFHLFVALQQAGLSLDAVRMVEVSPQDVTRAVSNNLLDAGVTEGRFLRQATANGGARLIPPPDDRRLDTLYVLAVPQERLESQRKPLMALLSAIVESGERLADPALLSRLLTGWRFDADVAQQDLNGVHFYDVASLRARWSSSGMAEPLAVRERYFQESRLQFPDLRQTDPFLFEWLSEALDPKRARVAR
ncbi:type 4a pilus biogenesis protein PilO [Magnetofaba australis]|uniref:Putative nitrate/sulfonate/bicarbonate ABC transporter periplasmic protein n=1 Tax=Magnetofaba australis IT-1 TaxID=1434232 RepID=A0A1Y2K9A8_9PROT|nr:type 4a pilus biogenesis protein PilO [Magnetofaba australis]OSM07334.1 putative nitrate/sulfonate/bicarbonate ABC transporter periplasmic protein [Magnetofaba australis IT-1]